MRKLLYIIGIVLLCSSCTRERAAYDFGVFEFDDPFYGISKEYRWSVLEKSLEYPPFSWFVDDSINYTTYKFNAEFNDECVKFKTPVDFAIADSNRNVIKGVVIDCDGVVTTNGHFCVIAKSSEQEVNINMQIPFEMGDTIFNGLLLVNGEDVDEVNETELNGEYEPIGDFYVEQDMSPNWVIWTIWFIIAAIILWLVYQLLKVIVLWLLEAISIISGFVIAITSANTIRNFVHKEKKKEKYKKEKEEEKKPKEPIITPSQGIYILNKIAEWHELQNGDLSRLPKYWREVMDRYYERNTFPMPPEYGDGIWSGKRGYSRWTPDESKRIKRDYDGMDYNPKQLTLKQMMMNLYGKDYIEFKKELPDFTPFASDSVEVEIELKPGSKAKAIRKSWQEEAKKILRDRMHFSSVGEVEEQYLKANLLTMHEHVDGKTILLVKAPIHISITHQGGCALVAFLCIPNIPTYNECKEELGKLGIILCY